MAGRLGSGINGCGFGYSAPALTPMAAPAPLPASGGVLFTAAQLAKWKTRVGESPIKPGAPNDWQRIGENAARFLAGEDPVQIPGDPSQQSAWNHGALMRDAAFVYLLTGDTKYLQPVRQHLLAIVANNDLTKLCIQRANGEWKDGYAESFMLIRSMAAYDFVRKDLSSADRITIESWFKRQGMFFAVLGDNNNTRLFPNRLKGDYSARGRSAADGTMLGRLTYQTGTGAKGPQLSELSQWFNNRTSSSAVAAGMAGLMTGDVELQNHAKRYFMEWLTYAVYPDGSEGEYARNGDYGIPRQGTIYGQDNIQAALLFASSLARQGDRSLYDFRTSDGLFGTQGGPKSIEMMAATHIDLLRKKRDWYSNENGAPQPETHMGRQRVQYEGGTQDTYNELGMLMAAPDLPNLPIAGVVLRDPAFTSEPFPTQGVSTALASQWTDAYGAYPAVLLLRP